MMRDRGYALNELEKSYLWTNYSDYEYAFGQFTAEFDRLGGNMFQVYGGDANKISISFLGTRLTDSKISKKEITDEMNKINSIDLGTSIKKRIFIAFNPLSPEANRQLNSYPDSGITYEHFTHDEMLLDPVRHILAPSYRKLTAIEILDITSIYDEDSITSHQLDIKNFPKLPKDETVVRRYGFQPGDIIELKFRNVYAGGPSTSYIEYRVVSSSASKK